MSSPGAPAAPLDGVRVLDLTQLLPGPLCTRLLADLGADVLKVEPPGGGDGTRGLPLRLGEQGAFFAALNRSKRSLVLDLKHPRGPEVLLRLARRADVVVEGFRPGVLARLGVGYEALRAARADIILCSITGFGQTGPDRDRAGHDIGFAARSGILALTGAPDRPPSVPGVQVADLLGGTWQALAAILAALWQRARTGQGQWLDVSMTDGAVAAAILPLTEALCGLSPAGRGQGKLTGGLMNYAVYPTRDGRHVAVGALEPPFLSALCAALGLGEPAGLTRERLAARLLELDRDEILRLLSGHDTCVEPVLEPAEVVRDPHHLARGMFVERPASEGPGRQVACPLRLLGAPVPHRPAPRLGEHTAAALTEAGYPAGEIAVLAEARAVRLGGEA